MTKTLGVAAVLLVLALLVVLWRTTQAPSPAAGTPSGQGSAASSTDLAERGACDDQPAPPPLPETLSPASADITAIVAALDAALNDQHKAWLRCFTQDDELLARTHHGMGRWLRATLHLTRRPELLTAMGAGTPDEASSLIILVYAAHLHGQELSLPDARTRRAEALAAAGVTQ